MDPLCAASAAVFLGVPGRHRAARHVRAAPRSATPLRPPFYLRLIGRQMIGDRLFLAAGRRPHRVFTGMVLALQIYTGFARFNAESASPTWSVLSVTRELGPVLAGLMVAGRVGAAIAAEIGTMRVTEQIDALTTLSTNPFKYLVAPRVSPALVMLPLPGLRRRHHRRVRRLSRRASASSASTRRPISRTPSMSLETIDVVSGLVKAAVFGFIIALMGCYHGYHSRGGAQGVGRRPPTRWFPPRS